MRSAASGAAAEAGGVEQAKRSERWPAERTAPQGAGSRAARKGASRDGTALAGLGAPRRAKRWQEARRTASDDARRRLPGTARAAQEDPERRRSRAPEADEQRSLRVLLFLSRPRTTWGAAERTTRPVPTCPGHGRPARPHAPTRRPEATQTKASPSTKKARQRNRPLAGFRVGQVCDDATRGPPGRSRWWSSRPRANRCLPMPQGGAAAAPLAAATWRQGRASQLPATGKRRA